jgi:hypothetical protein
MRRGWLTHALVGVVATAALGACTPSTSTDDRAATSAPASGAAPQEVNPDELLPAVRAFVAAVAAKDAGQVADTFNANGVVIDVSRRIEGRDAIQRWAANETVTGTLTVLQVVRNAADSQQLLVQFAPGGTGGFRANYTFTVDDSRISTLDMQYA